MSEFVSSDTIKRLVKDVKDIYKSPLNDNLIYYKHNDENVLKGYALLIGSENTPYYGGYYFFSFDFPSNYPFSPPKLTFNSNNDNIRYNPNLYRTGKVCLSILNTWKGEQWSSCQTIRTILLTLCTILNNKPLLNEPGITEQNEEHNKYNEILSYKNIQNNLIGIVEKRYNNLDTFFSLFNDDIYENLKKNYSNIRNYLKKKQKNKTKVIKTTMYSMEVLVDYKELYSNYDSLIKKLKIEKQI
jgi:ubiquitin-protein ligase